LHEFYGKVLELVDHRTCKYLFSDTDIYRAGCFGYPGVSWKKSPPNMELEFHFEWKRWSWSWLQSPILGTKTIFFRGIFNSDGYVVEAKHIGFLINMTNYSDKKKIWYQRKVFVCLRRRCKNNKALRIPHQSVTKFKLFMHPKDISQVSQYHESGKILPKGFQNVQLENVKKYF
jgi:hypothetical protein